MKIPARTAAVLFLIGGLAVTIFAGIAFSTMHAPEPIVAGPGVTKETRLSDSAPQLRGTPADTPLFVLSGNAGGGTMLLLGGTHPQEISGMLAAVLVVENVRVTKGRILVLPQANRSGFTHTDPLEAFPHTFEIATPDGNRWFRLGMRLTNPVHQWPDPDLYLHHPTGEAMVGNEARNLNRNYPGRPDGRYTERLGHAILQLAKSEKARIVLDMHEAYPEYPIINMIVAHERAFEIATLTQLALQMRKISMNLMPSPRNLHGLSHREFGDYTEAYAMLTETANPAMGRFRGRTDARLVTEGRDPNYVRAAELKRLFVPFSEEGHPIVHRVARQIVVIEEVLNAYNEAHPDEAIEIEGLPSYEELLAKGIGAFLRKPPGA
jgi:hypothetical protein